MQRLFPLLVFFVTRNNILKGCDGKNQGLKHILTLLRGVFGTLHHKCWIKNICKPIEWHFWVFKLFWNNYTCFKNHRLKCLCGLLDQFERCGTCSPPCISSISLMTDGAVASLPARGSPWPIWKVVKIVLYILAHGIPEKRMVNLYNVATLNKFKNT